MKDPLGYLLSHSRGSLDIVPLEWEGYSVFLLNHPADVTHALLTRQRHLARSGGPQRLERLLGEGLLRSHGERHQRQRRLTQFAFTPRFLASYERSMDELAQVHVGAMPDGTPFDMHERVVRLTLAIAAKTFFSLELHDDDAVFLGRAIGTTIATLGAGKNFFSEKLRAKRFRDACETADKILFRWIAQRRAIGPGEDLLSALVAARDDDGDSGMDDRQLRDELMTLFVAGHETTASAITWAVFLLGASPEWQARIREDETREAARAVFAETLRLYPPAWILFRRLLAPITLRGHEIAAGSHLVVSPYAMGRNPAVFAEPEKFLPARWLGKDGSQFPKGAFFPFGMGQRHCLGESFAWSEGKSILHHLCRQRSVELSRAMRVEEFPGFTLRPAKGLEVISRRRKSFVAFDSSRRSQLSSPHI